MGMPYRGQAQNMAANFSIFSVIMELSAVLLKVLSCPVTGNSLVYDREANLLVNKKDGLSYPPLLMEYLSSLPQKQEKFN